MEVVSGGERGREGDIIIPILPFKVSHMWVLFSFSHKGEVERGGKNKGRGREEGGRRWDVREVSTLLNAYEALSHTKLTTVSFFPIPIMHGWQQI